MCHNKTESAKFERNFQANIVKCNQDLYIIHDNNLTKKPSRVTLIPKRRASVDVELCLVALHLNVSNLSLPRLDLIFFLLRCLFKKNTTLRILMLKKITRR